MATQTYTQCRLVKTLEDGEEVSGLDEGPMIVGDLENTSKCIVDVAFIPTQFAKIGKTIKIKQKSGEWIDGWVVKSAGCVLPEDIAIKRSRDYLRQRKASDI